MTGNQWNGPKTREEYRALVSQTVKEATRIAVVPDAETEMVRVDPYVFGGRLVTIDQATADRLGVVATEEWPIPEWLTEPDHALRETRP